MLQNKNRDSLNQELFNHKTFFEKLEDNYKQTLFDVLFLLLKSQDVSMNLEIFFLSMELLQFLSFPLHPLVTNYIIFKHVYTYF